MSFYLNFRIPSLDTEIKLKEISFNTFKTLNKFLINKNDRHINEFFNEILKECVVQKDVLPKLTNFDKFCALFLLRCTSISPMVEFTEQTMSVKKPLLPFLNQCLDLKAEFCRNIYVDNYELKLTLPSKLYFEDIFEAFYDSVHSIYEKNKLIHLSESEKNSFIDNLPAEVTVEIKKFSNDIISSFSTLVFDIISTDKSTSLSLSPYNLSLFEVLKALFNSNLKSIFELQYILVSKLRYSAEYVDSNTLTENLILCNIYEQEMQKAKEEQENIDKTIPLNK